MLTTDDHVRLDAARAVLVRWAQSGVSQGDSSLRQAIAALRFLGDAACGTYFLPTSTREMLLDAVERALDQCDPDRRTGALWLTAVHLAAPHFPKWRGAVA
jgi:hypothetical protein